MLNLVDEDDEEFSIKPETSTKLANLFQRNELKLDIESSNKSLIYTPPKQPKKIEIASNAGNTGADQTTTSAVMTLIQALAVNVFKYENDKYSAQGKLGAALLGNHDTGSYKLILYTGKQQHITYASITENFKLICQPNNYSNFYDDNRQNWSVMFDSEEEKCNFSRQLTVCKYNTITAKSDNQSLILTQDLILSANDNDSAIVTEDNDIIDVRYKGWVFEDKYSCVGKLFINIDNTSKKPFRIKLIGKWIQVLKGMRIGGKRFAIIAANMKDQFPDIMENAPKGQSNRYGFEFEVIRIQPRVQQQNKTQQKSETKPKIETQKERNISGNTSEKEKNSGKRSHSSSLSDSVKEEPISQTMTNKSKSDMISRVARMGGMPILPIKSASDPTQDTTDATEEENSSQMKPFPKPRNSSITSNSSISNESSIPTTSTSNNNRIPENTSKAQNCAQMPITSMASTSYSTSIPTYFMPQTMDSNLSVLIAETHSNNTEIRMNLNKILDKIDSVSEKVNDIKMSSNPNMNSMSISSIGFMDSAILLSSIQRIVNENNSLKKELDEKNSNLQKLNEKICDLLSQQNIHSTGSHQNSQEIDRLLMNESRLKRELLVLNEDCDRFRTKNNDLNEENSRLRQTVKELQTETEKQTKVSNESNNSQTEKEFSQRIKRLMNEVFRKINAQIDENKSYISSEIFEIVSNSIRSATLSVIESQNNSRTNSPFRQSFDEIDIKSEKSQQNSNELNKKVVDISDRKESVKPPIPQRKSIETTQQQSNRNINTSDSENSKVSEESSESTEEQNRLKET